MLPGSQQLVGARKVGVILLVGFVPSYLIVSVSEYGYHLRNREAERHAKEAVFNGSLKCAGSPILLSL